MSLIANSEMRVRQAVRQIVTWLVAGDYVAIESKSNGIRLSADDFRHVINEFSHRLVMPPDSAFADFEIIEVQ